MSCGKKRLYDPITTPTKPKMIERSSPFFLYTFFFLDFKTHVVCIDTFKGWVRRHIYLGICS